MFQPTAHSPVEKYYSMADYCSLSIPNDFRMLLSNLVAFTDVAFTAIPITVCCASCE